MVGDDGTGGGCQFDHFIIRVSVVHSDDIVTDSGLIVTSGKTSLVFYLICNRKSQDDCSGRLADCRQPHRLMKRKSLSFPRGYAGALRKHLNQDAPAGWQTAQRLGRLAVALGWEILQLAKIHEEAVTALGLSGDHAMLKRAEAFFAEASKPIVETHHAARQSKIDLHQLNETLSQRTLELAATHRQLEHGILRRKEVEAALKKSGEHYSRLLKDSLELQEGLRSLTHQLLASQEEDRKKISQELQAEIAQTLLGINVRLLSLKREAKLNTTGLKNEIASTQRLVAKSTKSVRRVARQFRNA